MSVQIFIYHQFDVSHSLSFFSSQQFSSKSSSSYVKMPFGNPKLYIFSTCGKPNLLFSHTYECINISYILCSKPVSKNYHISIPWNITHLKKASLKCVCQRTSINCNRLQEALASYLHGAWHSFCPCKWGMEWFFSHLAFAEV